MNGLRRKRVLVVEDEYFLADDLRQALSDEGIVVVGPVASVDGALALLHDRAVDCAVLDINLHGRMVYPLARELRARAVPFLFVTGYDSPDAAEGLGDVELLQKPLTTAALMQGIGRLTGATG